MDVGVVGLGNLGAAIANLVVGNGHRVIGWEYDERVVAEINDAHVNSRFLPGVVLDANLVATTALREVFERAETVFVALPSVFIRKTLAPFAEQVKRDTAIVNLAKGIERATGLTSFQMIAELFPTNPKIMLSGPSIANEFARGMPTVVMIAGSSTTSLLAVAQLLDNRHFRVRFSDDAIGVELGGILKNAYAIGLGMFDGQQIESVNFRSVYLTLAIEEMARIGVSLGAQKETFAYLAGLGDLLATSLSQASHNRRMGMLLGTGHSLSEIERTMGVLPEGYNTIQTILMIAEKFHVPAPLAKGLWDVINGRYGAERFIYAFIHDFVD
ncbi:MAG TPA: NAD(P)H-dependent glycerol-3-phosphate dehydrogenase [Roseiflexaceae bacterium]